MKKPKVKYPHGIYAIDARQLEIINICQKGIYTLLPTTSGFEWLKITFPTFKDILNHGVLTPINKVPYEENIN